MRIVALEPCIVEVPLRRPVRGVHGVTAAQRSVLVRVAADQGSEGWGDVDPTPGYSRLSVEDIRETVVQLAPALIGLDPFNIRAALAVMDARVDGRWEAKAAVEMALCDLKARALGLPLHTLLGGRVKDRITLNAWIGTVPPAQAAAEAQDWLARGFASAKIKLEGADPEGLARVAAVRDAVGDGLSSSRSRGRRSPRWPRSGAGSTSR
jgi:L-alanine-DL-glutamate epimerase-like enolase superfamily enzyme